MKDGDIPYRIEKSKKGADTIIVSVEGRETPLHSRVDPERDADLFRDRFDPARYDLLVILGTGLGYHLTPLRGRTEEYHRVILVDILPGLEDRIRNNPATSFLVSAPQVIMLAGRSIGEVEDAVAGAIDMDRIRGVSVLEHPSSVRAFGDYYGALRKSVERIISRKAGDRATRQAFGGLFLGNAVRNITLMSGSMPVRDLFGRFDRHPAVIVAAGPSLDCHIGRLQALRDRLFIVSVDSALQVLSRSGIAPDIIISIDPQPHVQEHFLGCDTGGALIVHPLSCHPSVARRGGFLSLDSHPLAQLAAEVYGESIGSIDSASGSVAGDAVSLCLGCGFGAVAAAGLDFSFSGLRMYARGTAYQVRYALYFQDRLSTVEGYNARYIFGASGGLKIEGRFTRKSLVRYRESLEDYIRDRRVTILYTLNGPGLPLAGAPPIDLEEFAARHCAASIDREGIINEIKSKARRLNAAPLLDVLRAGGALLDTLVSASLGRAAGIQNRERYLRLIARACAGEAL